MLDLGELTARIVVDGSEGKKQLKEFGDEADKTEKKSFNLTEGLKKLAGALGVAIGINALKNFTGDVIDTTAKLQAMDAQFEQIFQGSEGDKALEEISRQAEELGIHTNRLKETFNSFGGQVKGAGMDATAALEATSKATTLAADAAAYYDKSIEDAAGSVASFMKGNFAAGDAIGVFTNAKQMDVKSNEKYGKSWDSLSEAERQWLLLDTIEKTYEMNGAVGQAAREQDNWANVTENLKATWESFLGIIGVPVLDLAINVIKKLTDGLSVLINGVSENIEMFAIMGIGIGTVVAAILAYNIAQNAAVIATTLATTATTAFGAAMAFITSPITLVILAIGAVIAIIYLLVKNWDWLKEKTLEIWENIKTTVSTKIEEIKTAIQNKAEEFKAAGKKVFTDLWEGIKEVWHNITTWITTSFDTAITTIKGFGTKAFDAGKEIMTKVWDGLKNVWTNITGWIADRAKDIADALMFWKKSKSEMDDDDSDGSHRNGLSYVPFDGYNSILHKGEMVLTQAEADRYRKDETAGNRTENFNVYIDKVENSNGRTTADLMREMEFFRKSKKLATGGA